MITIEMILEAKKKLEEQPCSARTKSDIKMLRKLNNYKYVLDLDKFVVAKKDA